ncbi:uncharacterized protein ACBT44_007327 isoform 1-T1 [Syngnathus typhle]
MTEAIHLCLSNYFHQLQQKSGSREVFLSDPRGAAVSRVAADPQVWLIPTDFLQGPPPRSTPLWPNSSRSVIAAPTPCSWRSSSRSLSTIAPPIKTPSSFWISELVFACDYMES